MDPLQSGLLTCATAVGAMFMKTLTTMILRRFGFRKVLTINALVASAAVGVFGIFTAATPHLVIFLVLLVSGCLRSLQFTSLQAISFAEVTRETMSQASSIASMAQRLAQSLGVALGAYALQVSSLAQGHSDIVTADFAPAFVAVALLSAVSIFFHAALPADAGAEVSGHGKAKVAGGREA
jgi:MFS family permease